MSASSRATVSSATVVVDSPPFCTVIDTSAVPRPAWRHLQRPGALAG